MTRLNNLDDEARAERLCCLVAGQLVARARTGEWLRTGHLVEWLNIWANGNGARVSWQDRLHLGARSGKVALELGELPEFADSDALAKPVGCELRSADEKNAPNFFERGKKVWVFLP
ncbi:hypothetical protein QS306_14705 [Paraburkholderia bonniea]|nr:hypothetical protein [Paraburkholderia bonniea]WJF92015.1 hypothetical protein QS306_14705 [Paraburkholderia bonniea]WJF95335.1 hypothetical protein QS308_14710 [Paraburkholderia bonniea]